MTQEKKLNKEVTELLPESVKECSKKLEHLQDQLLSMQSGDSDSHDDDNVGKKLKDLLTRTDTRTLTEN